jgi:hypothetical protein
VRPNYKLKPSRPGFGPAAEPPGPNSTRSASCWLQITCRCPAVIRGNHHAAIRVTARLPAAQLSLRLVGLTCAARETPAIIAT